MYMRIVLLFVLHACLCLPVMAQSSMVNGTITVGYFSDGKYTAGVAAAPMSANYASAYAWLPVGHMNTNGVYATAIENNVVIEAGTGYIKVSMPVKENISIFQADGSLFYQGPATTVATNKGIYIVKVCGQVRKVVVH